MVGVMDFSDGAEQEGGLPASPKAEASSVQEAPGPGRRAPRLKESLRALRHRNFRLFFGGQFISLVGTWMQGVAQSWLVYRLTGSSFLLGAVGFAGQIQVFLLASIGGTIADRYDRRRVVIATQSASMLLAFILAALTLTGYVRVWHIFVLAALLGAVSAFDIPARQSFYVEMVGKADLINAIALNSSMFNGARILGPAVAGILVASIGEGWCFFVNGVSYIAVITGLLLMDIRSQPRRITEASPLARILEGFRFVRGATPPGEPCGGSLRDPDAHLRRPDPSWRRARAWYSHGSRRGRGALRCPGPGDAVGDPGPWPMGGICERRFRGEPDSLLHVAVVLALGSSAPAGGLLPHGADRFVKHTPPVDGAR
jgi:hypothetical protein